MALLAADCMARVMTMANTDSTAATIANALPRFLPRNVPTNATIARITPMKPKIAAMLLIIGMKHEAKRAEHHADNAAHSQSLLFLTDRLQRGLGLDGLLRGDVTVPSSRIG